MEDRAVRLIAAATIIAIALGAALVWVALPGPSTTRCSPGGSGGTPLQTALALSTPSEETVGSDHWYNFSVGAAEGGWTLGNLNFQVQTTGGEVVSPGPGWSLTVSNNDGESVATYALTGAAANMWTSGGSVPLSSLLTIDLLTTPDTISGDALVVIEVGTTSYGCPAQGSISVEIP